MSQEYPKNCDDCTSDKYKLTICCDFFIRCQLCIDKANQYPLFEALAEKEEFELWAQSMKDVWDAISKNEEYKKPEIRGHLKKDG